VLLGVWAVVLGCPLGLDPVTATTDGAAGRDALTVDAQPAADREPPEDAAPGRDRAVIVDAAPEDGARDGGARDAEDVLDAEVRDALPGDARPRADAAAPDAEVTDGGCPECYALSGGSCVPTPQALCRGRLDCSQYVFGYQDDGSGTVLCLGGFGMARATCGDLLQCDQIMINDCTAGGALATCGRGCGDPSACVPGAPIPQPLFDLEAAFCTLAINGMLPVAGPSCPASTNCVNGQSSPSAQRFGCTDQGFCSNVLVSCGSYACSGNECLAACSVSNDCAPGFRCDMGSMSCIR
jgi:hypothetical protein